MEVNFEEFPFGRLAAYKNKLVRLEENNDIRSSFLKAKYLKRTSVAVSPNQKFANLYIRLIRTL